MLRKLTATAVTVAGITGGMLLGGPAHASSPTVAHHCFVAPVYCGGYGYYQPYYDNAWTGWYGYPYHRFHHFDRF